MVSIIIPVHNTAHFLPKCLNSVLNQTLKDIEVVIINDGSTDQSKEIIEEYCRVHKNIVSIDQQFSGPAIARNKAIKKTRGSYIGFVDSDDWIEPNMFEMLYQSAFENDADVVICNFSFYREKSDQLIKSNPPDLKDNITGEEALKFFLMQDGITGHIWNKLYRREMLLKYEISFPVQKMHEDVIFTIKSLYHSPKVAYIPGYYYYYRIREGSLTQAFQEEHTDAFKVLLDTHSFLNNINLISHLEFEYYFYSIRLIEFYLNNLIHAKSPGKIHFDSFKSKGKPLLIQAFKKYNYHDLISAKLIANLKLAIFNIRLYYLYSRFKIHVYALYRLLKSYS